MQANADSATSGGGEPMSVSETFGSSCVAQEALGQTCAMQLSKLFLCCLVWEARGADLLCEELVALASAACRDIAAVSTQDAEPQAPRDVSPGYVGERITRPRKVGRRLRPQLWCAFEVRALRLRPDRQARRERVALRFLLFIFRLEVYSGKHPLASGGRAPHGGRV